MNINDLLAKITKNMLFGSLLITISIPTPVAAYESRDFINMLDLYGDFRFRFEEDWDSVNSNGGSRDDRARSRIRARIGLKIKPNDLFEVNTRLRTGNKNSKQTSHWTIGDYSNNKHGVHHLAFDKWYVKAGKEQIWAWGGRNGIPFWKQNELLWDNDATVIGGAAGISKYELETGKVSINAGYVLLPDGMRETHGEMAIGQLVYLTRLHDVEMTVAGGMLAINGETPDADRFNISIRSALAPLDYTIWVANLQLKTEVYGLPVSLGFDYMHNSENYTADEIASVAGTYPGTTEDDTEGYVFQIRVGKNENQGDWLIGYSYANIETLAVHANYTQDDWIRWGDANRTDGNDFNGHEIRVAYVLPWKWKAMARYYNVESNNNPQDGQRFRIDFNRSFNIF